MNAPKSFKQMIRDGEVKRADAMKVRLQDIHEEPGFNLRREGEELNASIDALAAFIADGGVVPPLEVRPRAEGGVFVVDGHRRRRAYLKLLQAGAPITDAEGECWLSVVAFAGNDADRTARVITSAEGRSLSLLEVAEGYKRLTRFNWSPDDIARKVGKTRQHVDQALILANANADVHDLVASGAVAATTAIDAVRKHGEGAGAFLRGKLEGAKGGKVRASDVAGKALPRKVVDDVVARIEAFDRALPMPVRAVLFASVLPDDATVTIPARDLAELLKVQTAIVEARDRQAARGRERAHQAAQGELVDDGEA